MAIILIGKSRCPLCGEILTAESSIISLPAISDVSNPLYHFFDSGIHESCFEKWGKKSEIDTILKDERIRYESSEYYKEMLAKYEKPNNSN
jgi:hypothetical protein